MSNSRDVTVVKKKDQWEEAAGEFYAESYPCGSGQPASTANTANNTRRGIRMPLLPSQTARRNSASVIGRRGRRKSSLLHGSSGMTQQGNNSNVTGGNANNATFTSTMAVGTTTNDIHVAILPDLADESLPNERKTWEELMKIKAMPISIAQKRELKSQLNMIPKLRLKGWNLFKWHQMRFFRAISAGWTHRARNFVFLQGSLRTIETCCGTSIVNVFLFIKWTLLLNLAMFLVIVIFIILPFFLKIPKVPTNFQNCSSLVVPHHQSFVNSEIRNSSVPDGPYKMNYSNPNFGHCCSQEYALNWYDESRGSIGAILRTMFGLDFDIGNTPFFYGFFEGETIFLLAHADFTYNFGMAYALVTAIIYLFCLLLMVRNIGIGVKEMILAREGELYKYSSLIFAGWDHYTKDASGAAFKRKVLRHEMQVALQTEKMKLDYTRRSPKQSVKLLVIRFTVNLIVLALLAITGTIIFFISAYSFDYKVRQNDFESMWWDTNTSMIPGDLDLMTTTEPPGQIEMVSLSTMSPGGGSGKKKPTVQDAATSIVISFAPSIFITFANLFFPAILTRLGKLEKYSIEVETTWVLIRALFVRLLAIVFAVSTFYLDTYCKPRDNYCTRCDAKDPENALTDNHKRLTNVKTCWESLFAEQIYKLVIADLVLKVIITFVIEPTRCGIAKLCPSWGCIKSIGDIRFNIVRHSLDIIYLQVLSWLGFYFAPTLPGFVVLYCLAVFFIKKFSVLVTCGAVPDTYRTTRTTTIFIATKLISFIACAFTIVFVLGYTTPSRGCGPFRSLKTPWEAVSKILKKTGYVQQVVEVLTTPGVTTPVTVVLFLLTYYYYSVAQANRSMVDTLRHLLILEGHDKQYLFARLNTLRRKASSGSLRSDTTLDVGR